MKTIIAYYSYTGHVKRAVEALGKALASRGSVSTERLEPEREVTTFVGQCKAAFTRERAVLRPGLSFDASPYDLIVIASPVWAFAPVPAVNAWLDKVNGLSGKRAVILLTSGSGAGVGRCFKAIQSVLEHKGVAHVERLNIPDRRSRDEAFVSGEIARVLAEAA